MIKSHEYWDFTCSMYEDATHPCTNATNFVPTNSPATHHGNLEPRLDDQAAKIQPPQRPEVSSLVLASSSAYFPSPVWADLCLEEFQPYHQQPPCDQSQQPMMPISTSESYKIPTEPLKCWEHGCDGRTFSTTGNHASEDPAPVADSMDGTAMYPHTNPTNHSISNSTAATITSSADHHGNYPHSIDECPQVYEWLDLGPRYILTPRTW